MGERLRDKRVCVCVGAGGVGKTTVSAALALGLAAHGHRALVVSIDPARRLATALGLEELPGEPHMVDPHALADAMESARQEVRPAGEETSPASGEERSPASGEERSPASGEERPASEEARPPNEPAGELWAMMLDPKGTFDQLIGRLAPDERAREEVLANPIYRELSTATAGSQEFTAVAKLFELEREGGFDVIVLDTPPSRNALDFLDAPDRLTRFLEGRALRALLRPGGIAGGLLGRGTGLVFAVLARATGVNLLGDLSKFFRSLGVILDGFSERARGVERLLRDERTSFLIVTSPEHEPASEAAFFHAQLLQAGMGFGGLVVNRMHDGGLDGYTPERLRELISEQLEEGLAVRLVDNLADFDVLARRDRETVELLAQALSEPDPLLVPQLDGDVQDLAGLARIAAHLFAGLDPAVS
jgi:anion-transporting  ArsA/GET3 family ATPase